MANSATKNQNQKGIGTTSISTPSDRTIVIRHVFAAPRPHVFDALFKPELVKLWAGPAGSEMTQCTIDFRVGGEWRYVFRMPNGKLVGMHGVFREIVPNERFVATEAFDDKHGESINTGVLTEAGGTTTLVLTVLYQTTQLRDSMLHSSAEPGPGETYDRLDEVLKGAAAGGSRR